MYTTKNFKTKKAVKEALSNGEIIQVYQPGPFGSGIIKEGKVTLEGPHYPEMHTWYGVGEVRDYRLVNIK